MVAATAVGAAGREAAARMMLGLSLVYVEGDSGLPELEAALRLAEEAADHALALRGHLNLSDALQTLGRSRESAEVAERGAELAARVGLTRSVYGVLVASNLAEAQFHLGHWDDGHRVLTRAIDHGLASPFASVILDHRARIAALAGRYDDARADIDTAHRLLPARHGSQYSFARAFAAAEIGRALGDTAGAREEVRRALEHEALAPIPRFTWQLVWLGLRVEAEASEPAPDRLAALATLSCALSAMTPPELAYRALADGESGRAGRREADWTEAIEASRRAGDPYLIAYALLRQAEVASAAADRETASAGAQEAARLAAALGARRCSPTACAGTARAPADQRGRARATDGRGRDLRIRPDPARARGAPPRRRRTVEPPDRRSAVHKPQDRERPCVEHPRQARRREPRRSRCRGPSPRARRRRLLSRPQGI